MEPAFNTDVVSALAELRHLLLTEVVVEASETSQTLINPWLDPCLFVAAESLAVQSWSGEELEPHIKHARQVVLGEADEDLTSELLHDLHQGLGAPNIADGGYFTTRDEMWRVAAMTILEAILSGGLIKTTVRYG